MKKEVLRMCIACRQMKPKEELIRVVFTSEDYSQYVINASKVNGRGSYICKNKDCINKCIKNKSFNRIFKTNLTNSVYEDLSKVELNEG